MRSTSHRRRSLERLIRTAGFAVLFALAACGSDTTTDTSSSSVDSSPPTTARSVQTTSATESTSNDVDEASAQGAQGLDGLTVRVDEEIRFAAGGTSATVSGAVIRGERDVYRLGAAGGQQLIVEVSSVESNGVVDVVAPDGTMLAQEVTSATVDLPSDGDYLVIVGGTRGNVSYDLTVTIPA